MSNAKRRHRMRRRFERRFDLMLAREMGWQNDRKAQWNRLMDKCKGLMFDNPHALDLIEMLRY
jgi:hypothetical protein